MCSAKRAISGSNRQFHARRSLPVKQRLATCRAVNLESGSQLSRSSPDQPERSEHDHPAASKESRSEDLGPVEIATDGNQDSCKQQSSHSSDETNPRARTTILPSKACIHRRRILAAHREKVEILRIGPGAGRYWSRGMWIDHEESRSDPTPCKQVRAPAVRQDIEWGRTPGARVERSILERYSI